MDKKINGACKIINLGEKVLQVAKCLPLNKVFKHEWVRDHRKEHKMEREIAIQIEAKGAG